MQRALLRVPVLWISWLNNSAILVLGSQRLVVKYGEITGSSPGAPANCTLRLLHDPVPFHLSLSRSFFLSFFLFLSDSTRSTPPPPPPPPPMSVYFSDSLDSFILLVAFTIRGNVSLSQRRKRNSFRRAKRT